MNLAERKKVAADYDLELRHIPKRWTDMNDLQEKYYQSIDDAADIAKADARITANANKIFTEAAPAGMSDSDLEFVGWATAQSVQPELKKLADRITELEQRESAMGYKGVWRPAEFKTGDFVSWGGSMWHCNATTRSKPGASDGHWTLAVKAGRDAR